MNSLRPVARRPFRFSKWPIAPLAIASGPIALRVIAGLLGAVFITRPAFAIPATIRADAPFTLNSVSVLFPAPTPQTIANYPRAGDPKFISPTLLESAATPALSEIDPESRIERAVMVAIRIDPCFRETLGGTCERHVRAVWQVPKIFGSRETDFFDGALHTFHRLTEEQWRTFLAEWTSIWKPHAARLRGLPLGVNPVLEEEGVRGSTFERLRVLLGTRLPSSSISRIAFSVLYFRPFGTFEGGWKFSIADVRDGRAETLSIPTLSGYRPVFLYENFGDDRTFDGKDSVGGSSDAPETDRIHRYLKSSADAARLTDAADRDRLFRSMRRLQNPGFHAAGSTDCISCHAAAASERAFAPNLSAEERARADGDGQVYVNPRHDLTASSPNLSVTRNFRMFGYFRGGPSINPRVIHESAEVADALNGSPAPPVRSSFAR